MKEAVDLLAKRMSFKALKLYINQGSDLKTRNPHVIKHEKILWALAHLPELKQEPSWETESSDMKAMLLSSLLHPRDGILAELSDEECRKLVQ